MRPKTLVAPLAGLIVILALVFAGKPSAHAAPAAQPEMQAALTHLHEAQTNLEKASRDKGGHRVKAIEHIKQAIAEVEAGIQYDDTHKSPNEK